MRTPSYDQRGFSLLETVVALAITAVALIALSTFQRDIFYFNRVFTTSFTSQGEARKVIKSLTEEIRIISIASTGAYPIATATANSLTFYSDNNGDGAKERIRYFVSGTTLRKGVLHPSGAPLTYNAASETVTDVVQYLTNGAGTIFEYYDAAYDGTTAALAQPVTVANIRLIKITLTIDKTLNSPPGPVTITTQVSMRNLKDNL